MTNYGWGPRGNLLPWVLFYGLTVWSLACGPAPSEAPAPPGPTWLARCGNQVVEAQEFQTYLEQQTHRNPRLHITPAMKRDLLEKYLEKKLLLVEANRQGVGDKPEVIKELAEMKEQILLKHLLARQQEELAKSIKVDDKELQQYYKDMTHVVHFRYAPAAGPDQAKIILNNWTKKSLAAEIFDSGEVSLATLNETWKRQILRLPVKHPQIINIDLQWFVVEVVNKREEAVLPLDQVMEQIIRDLTDRKEKEILQNWVNSLKGQNRLEINEAYNWR
jgi:hypothetical protein